jgi:hypothetical protein
MIPKKLHYGKLGRIVGIDPNGRPILEVNDSENSVAKETGDASTSVHVDSNLNNVLDIDERVTLEVVNLENTVVEVARDASTTTCAYSQENNIFDDDSILNWEAKIKPTLSDDSEGIRMSLFFSDNESIRHGAVVGCLHCTDLLDKGHSINKHSTTCPVSKHHAGIGNEGDMTGSPASKCHSRTTTEFDERPDSNIEHIKDIEIVVLEETCALGPIMEKHVVRDSNDKTNDNVHDNAHHFEDQKQLDEHFDICEEIQDSNEMYFWDIGRL